MRIIGYSAILIGLVMLVYIFRAVFRKQKSLPVKLFAAAVRDENKGDYESAILLYETALEEERKSKFPSAPLQEKIHEKLKVLRTVTSYQENFHFENKLWSVPKN